MSWLLVKMETGTLYLTLQSQYIGRNQAYEFGYCSCNFRPNSRDVIVFITDGQTVFEDRAVLYDVIPDVLSQATVIGVGIGPVELSEMRRIVSDVFETNYIPVDDFEGLYDAVPKVVAALQSNLDFSNECKCHTGFNFFNWLSPPIRLQTKKKFPLYTSVCTTMKISTLTSLTTAH